MNTDMLCMNTDMLCMNTDMLCMSIGMLCMNIGMLCMNIGMLCMHVGIVSSINAIDMLEILCMLNLTQITPHKAPATQCMCKTHVVSLHVPSPHAACLNY